MKLLLIFLMWTCCLHYISSELGAISCFVTLIITFFFSPSSSFAENNQVKLMRPSQPIIRHFWIEKENDNYDSILFFLFACIIHINLHHSRPTVSLSSWKTKLNHSTHCSPCYLKLYCFIHTVPSKTRRLQSSTFCFIWLLIAHFGNLKIIQ